MNHSAQYAPLILQLPLQAETNFLHPIAWLAWDRDLEHSLANRNSFSSPQITSIQSDCGYVFSQNAGVEIELHQGLLAHQQNLSFAPGPCVYTAGKAPIRDYGRFIDTLHWLAVLVGNKQM
jgi:hypothetical protein